MTQRYGLEIRSATSLDAPGLAALMTACGYPVSPGEIAERLEGVQQDRGSVLIALEWGPPSGLVALHWHRTLDSARPFAEITMLLVGPDERRRGVGRLLLKAAARSARLAGCDLLRLYDHGERDGLRAFCAANGFSGDAVGFVRALRKRGTHSDP